MRRLFLTLILAGFLVACSDSGPTNPGGDVSGTDSANVTDSNVNPEDTGAAGTDVEDATSSTDSAGEDGSGPEADAGDGGDSGQPDITPDTGTVEPDVPAGPQGYPSEGIHIKITSPGGGGTASVMGSKTTVAGLLFGDVDTITWASSNDQNGEIKEGTYWQSGPIDLVPGDNVITVTASAGAEVRSDTIVITYNPAFKFDKDLDVRPRAAWSGTNTNFIFRTSLGIYGNAKVNTAKLLQVDENGNLIKDLGSMKDTGNTSGDGDEIQADGVFSYKLKNFNCGEPGPLYFRATVKVGDAGSEYDAYTPTVKVWCLEHLQAADCSGLKAVVDQAESQALGGMATDDVVTALEQNPLVKSAGRAAGNGNGIWIQFNNGVLGAVMLNPPGQRGAGPNGASAGPAPANGGNVLEIGSRNAIVLAPFSSEFGATDDGPDVASMLASSACPSFDLAGNMALVNNQASLDKFRSISSFGVVSVSSHGDALFGGIGAKEKKDTYHWNHEGAHEVIWSGEAVNCQALSQNKKNCTPTEADPNGGCPSGSLCVVTETGGDFGKGVCLDRNQVDLRLGRTVITNKGYAMTPAFFDAYAVGGYPQSVVNFGACRSLYNGTLAATIFGHGAKTITGFSGYVDSAWAAEQVKALFQGSVGVGQVGLAHTGEEEPSNPGTYWRILGAGNLDLSRSEIINASFEAGDTTGWRRAGDGRVITQLGVVGPPQGKFMGVISTGLGFTQKLGLLEQDFCIPEDKTKVDIYWRFFSEEFLEYCGSPYQDTFQAVLKGAGGQITVVDLKIDDLCGYGDGSCGQCQNPTPCDPNCMGVAGCEYNDATGTCSGTYPCECGKYFYGLVPATVGFDQGGVYKTATWLKTTKNIKGLSGQGKVTLTLSSSDTGDSIYDTVILIDAIKFN